MPPHARRWAKSFHLEAVDPRGDRTDVKLSDLWLGSLAGMWDAPEVNQLRVRSRDGTHISAHYAGEGPPLLLVHGATADHSTTWLKVGPMFERRFTVYRMDRRGRGESEDAPTYAIEREFEDVAAVVDSIGGPVYVLGHSYGAEVVLGALLATGNIRKFVHYEGGIPAVYPTPAPMIDRIEELIDAGDPEGALAFLFREIVGIDPAEFRAMSGEDAWAARLRNIHTLPRELRGENDFDLTTIEPGLGAVRVPTLLLLGEESPRELVEPSKRLAGILPNHRIETIAGQGHAAMFGAPQAFVDVVNGFLDA